MCNCKFKRNFSYSSLKTYDHLLISHYTSAHSFHFSKCEHHSRVKYFIYPYNFSNVCSDQPLLYNGHCWMSADADKRVHCTSLNWIYITVLICDHIQVLHFWIQIPYLSEYKTLLLQNSSYDKLGAWGGECRVT